MKAYNRTNIDQNETTKTDEIKPVEDGEQKVSLSSQKVLYLISSFSLG